MDAFGIGGSHDTSTHTRSTHGLVVVLTPLPLDPTGGGLVAQHSRSLEPREPRGASRGTSHRVGPTGFPGEQAVCIGALCICGFSICHGTHRSSHLPPVAVPLVCVHCLFETFFSLQQRSHTVLSSCKSEPRQKYSCRQESSWARKAHRRPRSSRLRCATWEPPLRPEWASTGNGGARPPRNPYCGHATPALEQTLRPRGSRRSRSPRR